MTSKRILTVSALLWLGALSAAVPPPVFYRDAPLSGDAEKSAPQLPPTGSRRRPAEPQGEPRFYTVTAPLTVIACFRPAELSGYRQLLFKGNRAAKPQQVALSLNLYDGAPQFGYMNAEGAWRGLFRNGDIVALYGKKLSSLSDFPKAKLNEWNVLVAGFDGSRMRVWLNGKLVAEGSEPSSVIPPCGAPFRIGVGEMPGGKPGMEFNGEIGPVAFYDRALDEAGIREVLGKMKAPAAWPEPADPRKAAGAAAVNSVEMPVLEIRGNGNPLLSDAMYHSDYKVLHCDLNELAPVLDDKGVAWNPEALTVAAWVMPRGGDGNYRQIAFKSRRTDVPSRVAFKFGFVRMVPEFGFLDASGRWGGILKNAENLLVPGKKTVPLSQCEQLRPDRWNFVAAVFDRGKVSLYLDGKLVSEGDTGVEKLLFGGEPLRIGHGEDAGGAAAYPLDGLLDRVGFYASALSAAQIGRLYREGRGRYPEGEVKLASARDAWRKEYDPEFKNKLALVKAYETALPVSDLLAASPTVTVGEHAGVPALCRDGVFESAMCMIPFSTADNRGIFNATRDFAAAGIDYGSEILWPWIKWGDNCSGWWTAPGEYDFKKIEDRLRVMVEANPKIRLIVRIKLNVPGWWLKQYPEELSVNAAGGKSPQPSMSSKRWSDDSCRMLGDLVRHLENSDLAPHIVGYLPAGGETSEWFWWGARQGLIDYSPSGTAAFRNWLREIYADDAALRRAWNDPAVTFDTAAVPAPEKRDASEDGYFRDVIAARPVTDYRRFLSDMTSRAIRRATRTVRENLRARKLIGAFYGYSMYLAGGSDRIDNHGMQNLSEILADPDLDFLCSPLAYDRRRGGQEGNFILGYTGSLRLHNKLYWDEADMRTHLCDSPASYRTATPDETSMVNWRVFGNSLVQGTYIWWLLLADNAGFHSERIMGELARMAKLDRELLDVSKASAAEIAVFCDEKSMLYVNQPSPREREYVRLAQAELFRSGAASDFYLLSDISNPKLRNYKLYIFLNAWFVTPEQREAIHRKLAENRAAALWFYAPGYLSPKGSSVGTMKALTGFGFRKETIAPAPLRFTGVESPVTAGRTPPGRQYGFDPGFVVDDPEATALATLGGVPALAVREMPWGRSFYSLTPLSAGLVRGICRAEKIHLYSEGGDVVQANRNFLMLHAVSAGKKRVILPERCGVRNLLDDKTIDDVDSFEVELGRGDTVIYQLIRK